MTGNRKRLIYLLLGLCAGLTAFAATELISKAGFSGFLSLSITQGAVLGFIFGFVFGSADGIIYKEIKNGLLKALTAAAIGAAAAAAAQILAIQGMLWSSGLLNMEYEQSMKIMFPIWRGLGWMLMGMAIGAVDGIHRRSLRRSTAGIIGGLFGGLLGGLGLEFFAGYIEQTAVAQSAGLILLGLLTGLFIGEFERRFSYARLRVLNGSLKDREFMLLKKKTRIGKNLNDDVYLHGYKAILPFIISRVNNEIYLIAESDGRKTVVLNEQPVSSEPVLKYQDVIQTGSVKLLFLPL